MSRIIKHEILDRKRRTDHTVKFDSDLMNQVDFLAAHLEIKKAEVLRQVIKKKIQSLGLWDKYQEFPKKFPLKPEKPTRGGGSK